MAFKRVTIVLDDTPDTRRQTETPPSLLERSIGTVETDKTGVPADQEDYDKPLASEAQRAPNVPRETTGRTPWDLASMFLRRPQFPPTALTAIALAVFSWRISEIRDFWMPIAGAALLNIVWYGVGWLCGATRRTT